MGNIAVELTNSIDEHCKAPQGSNGVSQVLLGIVKLLDVTADLLHHHLALFSLAADLIDLGKKLLNLHFGLVKVLPTKQQLNQSSLVICSNCIGLSKVTHIAGDCRCS